MADTILQMIEQGGYVAVFLLMCIENVFPPIPSEVILPLIGMSIADGTISYVPTLLAATLGSVVGGSMWYGIGLFMSETRLRKFLSKYGVYVAIGEDELEKAVTYFKKVQIPAVLVGRFIPTIRTVISLPAGIVGMPVVLFLTLSTIGTLIWNVLLIGSGFLLSGADVIEHYLNPVANIIIGFFLLAYILQVIRYHARRRRRNASR
jgi:membrane protein DedA with SNARE-associated domain